MTKYKEIKEKKKKMTQLVPGTIMIMCHAKNINAKKNYVPQFVRRDDTLKKKEKINTARPGRRHAHKKREKRNKLTQLVRETSRSSKKKRKN